jgi:3-isopropylmalate dehydrogenase
VKHYSIAVLPGDGIGPEIMAEAIKVLEVIGKRFGVDFKLTHALVGGASIDASGRPLTDEVLKLALDSHAVMLGAVGGPK